MLPVVSGVRLPDSFQGVPKSGKLHRMEMPAQEHSELLKAWLARVSR
jgi:hypothetical protein